MIFHNRMWNVPGKEKENKLFEEHEKKEQEGDFVEEGV